MEKQKISGPRTSQRLPNLRHYHYSYYHRREKKVRRCEKAQLLQTNNDLTVSVSRKVANSRKWYGGTRAQLGCMLSTIFYKNSSMPSEQSNSNSNEQRRSLNTRRISFKSDAIISYNSDRTCTRAIRYYMQNTKRDQENFRNLFEKRLPGIYNYKQCHFNHKEFIVTTFIQGLLLVHAYYSN